jgi:WD40 repeat protein
VLDPEGTSFDAWLGPQIELSKQKNLWVLGVKANVEDEIILFWSKFGVHFQDLDGKPKFSAKRLTKGNSGYEDHISDVLLYKKFGYFVCAMHSGAIIVKKFGKRHSTPMHVFNSHQKRVTSLMPMK